MSKLTVKKTQYWKLQDGEVCDVSQLPPQIQQQVEIFDSIREDLTDIKYQEQVYSLALAAKNEQLEQIISSIVNAQKQQADQQAPAAPQQTSQDVTQDVTDTVEE